MKKFSTIITLIACLFLVQSAYAIKSGNVVTNETAISVADMTKKDAKLQKKMEKRMAKLQKKLAKKGVSKEDIDFNDPVEKWMWYWIFGWGISIVIGIIIPIIFVSGGIGGIGILGALAGLCGLFGTVSLVIWLVKKFA